jgi:hypothetical protein
MSQEVLYIFKIKDWDNLKVEQTKGTKKNDFAENVNDSADFAH